MIKRSAEYEKAITAFSRRQLVKAAFDLSDPDMVIKNVAANNNGDYSKIAQVTDRGMDETEQSLGTFEVNRWKLDGSFEIAPTNPNERKGQAGWESKKLSGTDGYFSEPYPTIEQSISGVEILQAVTIQFSSKSFNGYGVEFTVDVYSNEQLMQSKTITDNTETRVVIDTFEVYFPTKVTLTIKRWNLESRRVRDIRFLVGLYEGFDTTKIKNVDIYTESTFSNLALPYSTCTIEVYNENQRFNPYSPTGLFKSIEERQPIKTELGLELADGTVEWLPSGIYYQQNGGWQINDLTVRWSLLDIIGMLANRRYVMPESLPTNFSGWIESIMASLGVNFRKNYEIDSDLTNIPLTATKEDVQGVFCGELLRYACMAVNAWASQNYSNGYLHIGKIERIEGNKITLDNMPSYAVMSANDDVADITFTLDNGEVTFAGTNTDSDQSLSVNNPFVHNEEQARKAVISCLFEYGGKHFEVKSRGNPSSETGDLMTVETQFGTTITARLYKQQLKLDQGVMRNVPSYLVQSPNDSIYANKQILTGAGEWQVPEGVTKIKISLIGGGQGGQGGGGGIMTGDNVFNPQATKGGSNGYGGKVYIVEINVNPSQSFLYSCGIRGKGGLGGEPYQDGMLGTEGEPNTFGQFTSDNGKIYANGLMDIQTGNVYAATGSKYNTLYGCGGLGGEFGENGYQYQIEHEPDEAGIIYETIVASRPKAGKQGLDGKDGCIILEW